MGSESKHRNGDGYGGREASAATAPQGVPVTAKKVVQSVKEIVNCTEQEIYAVLKECDMDPNRAVERLLAQDTFHEVRSKRERRKEMKEAMDSRTRVSNVGLSRGGRTGTGSDRSVIQSGLTHVTYNEQGKAADKVEVGSVGTSVTSSTTHVGGKNTKIMGSKEDKSISPLKEEIFHKFRDFMTGITMIDELGTAGSKLLSGFQQALEFIRRPPIDTNSKLVNKIILANATNRVKSYVNYGCRNPNDSVQNVTNLHSCKQGLLNHISKARVILNELEGLLGDVTSAIQSTNGNLSSLSDLDFDAELNEQDQNAALSHSQNTDVTTTKKTDNTDVTHLASLMAILYSMVKQDYLMQERIVSALDLKVSSEELGSYCQMWSLRPFINDDIMHQAWELIP